jgi:predicted methyltransferase
MAQIDLRKSLNAISDVVNNRPPPLRAFDQIYMKTADLLLHAEHAGHCFKERDVVFIGDGDAIGLCLIHLHNQGLLPDAPAHVHIMDFDERVVLSVRSFAKAFDIQDRVTSELYNIAEPLTRDNWQRFGGFHINPPFGQSNNGRSIEAFLNRAFEASGPNAVGCIILADDARYSWTREVLYKIQQVILQNGWMISELLPEFHHYHLDDVPDLTSCSLVIRRNEFTSQPYRSEPLPKTMLENFYGEDAPLNVRYVRDRTGGGKLLSKDYDYEGFK